MGFLETVVRAKTYLREHGRVSLRGLQREFDLDQATLDELIEELVTVQQVAACEGKILAWIGSPSSAAPAIPSAVHAAAAAGLAVRPLAGERRQLTVLFCDLVDSTRLASELDPEDWREILGRYQQSAAAAVARFDGHVAQYLGDGLLVYFGYPQAHEDDAERAVRAGLAILEAVGDGDDEQKARGAPRLALRVGIHTGLVVVGGVGDGASHEMLAMGETTNLAARLQGEAAPDSVVLSAATLRLVQGIFVTRDLGLRELKGLREPVRVHQALRASGVRSRLDVTSAEALTPLVGREQELGLLLGRWELVQDGIGQVVIVSGDAGIGKSRLLQALRERLAETPHTWLECHGSSFTRDSAFHPVIELLRTGLRFVEDEPPEAKLAKLTSALEQNEMAPAEHLPLLAALLSLPLPAGFPAPSGTPERVKRLTLETLVQWLLRLGRLQPLVLALEDLHWVDPSTLELIERIVAQARTQSVFVVLTHRPDFALPWPVPAHATRIAVGRVSRRQAAAMVESIAGSRRLPDAVMQAVLERTDGVPLFLEELTRALLESDVIGRSEAADATALALAIPATLQDSLTARLDSLRPAKEVAQLAATIGREFRYEVLEAASLLDPETLESALERLVEADLLYQRGTAPHASYVFKHALVQETAYQSLLKGRRQQFHRQIAEALESRFAEAAEGQPEQLAHHLTQAGLAARAIPCWQRAGQRALERSANVEAIRHLQQGLTTLERVGPGPERDAQELGLRTLLGIALIARDGYAAPVVLSNFARAREVCDALGDVPARFPVLLGLFRFYLVRAERDATAQLVDQCLALAERAQDPLFMFFAQLAAGMRAFYAGAHERSRELLASCLSLYEPGRRAAYTLVYGQDPAVSAQMHAAWNEWYLGFPDRAREIVNHALADAEGSGQVFGLAGGYVSASRLWGLRGEGEAALRHAEASIAISREQGFSTWLWAGMLCRGTAFGLLGRKQEAIAQVREATELAQSLGSRLFAPHAMSGLSSLLLEAAQPAEAMQALEAARELLRSNLDVYEEAEIHRLHGEALLHAGRREDVEACFRRALAISRERRTRSLELRAATSLARFWRDQAKPTRALELLRPVYEGFSEGFETRDLKSAAAVLRSLE